MVLHVSRTPVPCWRTPGGSTAGRCWLGVGLRLVGAALPMVDAAATSFSLLAQALQTRKWIENWLIWIAVDAVYVVIYVSQGLSLTAGLYAVFLVMAAVWTACVDTFDDDGAGGMSDRVLRVVVIGPSRPQDDAGTGARPPATARCGRPSSRAPTWTPCGVR